MANFHRLTITIGSSTSARRRTGLASLLVMAALLGKSPSAQGQVQLADDIVVLSQGLRAQESARTNSHLGAAPGAAASRLPVVPGSGEPTLGEAAARPLMARRDVLSAAAAAPGSLRFAGAPETIIAPPPRLSPAELPLYGPLEVPSQDEEGPPDGLSLDMEIDQVSRNNFDLRTKFQEIPKAQADILSAGLRGNPLVFGSADQVPYGSYSPQRPGENGFGITVIQPFDVNHKRRVRILAAQRAKRVIDAQYQDAVRLEIDNLYTAFVDVLAAREAVRYLEASLTGLDEIVKRTKKQIEGRERSAIDLDRIVIQRDSASLALRDAIAAQSKALETLALQLNVPAVAVDQLKIRGSITTTAASVASVEELVALAKANRPDLVAYRLGIQRAQADVDLARAEAFPDVFVLYTPYGFRNNGPIGGQNATSWSLGMMASVPLFNRNQGNVRRAEINVAQTSTELNGIERQIETEVRRASKDLETAQAAVRQLEQDMLPRARAIRDRTLNLYKSGEEGTLGYLNAQREYSDVVRQYRDALIRQRRAALRINTVIALRIVP
ncbi:MAG: TolC family protein [Hyphomonadaceae bacterium]|nr:TolC family protein [Hyphomonadaceae bacterium]